MTNVRVYVVDGTVATFEDVVEVRHDTGAIVIWSQTGVLGAYAPGQWLRYRGYEPATHGQIAALLKD